MAFHGHHSRARGSRNEEVGREGLTEIHLKVTGMTCGSCVAYTKKSLAKLTGEPLYTTLLYPQGLVPLLHRFVHESDFRD